MHGFSNFGFGMGHISMMFLWLLIIGFIIWAIVSPKGIHTLRKESPLDIAKQRYAKGEISQKELDDIKHNL
jgi:putative membrane protein